MSLEGLLKELDQTRKIEQERAVALVREQHEALLRAKDEEISALKEEIATLRDWLDHSALPAHNPISRRSDSMGLIKINFGKDKPCPEMWSPGEKNMLDAIPRNSEDSLRWPDAPSIEPNENLQHVPVQNIPEAPELHETVVSADSQEPEKLILESQIPQDSEDIFSHEALPEVPGEHPAPEIITPSLPGSQKKRAPKRRTAKTKTRKRSKTIKK